METIPERLAYEYREVIDKYYPRAGQLLNGCYIKVIDCFIERLGKRVYYLGIYCPDELILTIYTYHKYLKEVAENMGLVEVVLINASNVIRDPLSKLKADDPRLWLELYWLATQKFNH
jgi:hypothetical protein